MININLMLNEIFIMSENDENSGCASWLIWIGLLLLINLLSWIFDWSFWVY